MAAYSALDQKENLNQYIVELAKAAGIAAGVMQEAAALVGDFHQLVRISQGMSAKKGQLEAFSLEDLLGGLKGDGNAN